MGPGLKGVHYLCQLDPDGRPVVPGGPCDGCAALPDDAHFPGQLFRITLQNSCLHALTSVRSIEQHILQKRLWNGTPHEHMHFPAYLEQISLL